VKIYGSCRKLQDHTYVHTYYSRTVMTKINYMLLVCSLLPSRLVICWLVYNTLCKTG